MTRPLRALVACETSGAVLGHIARVYDAEAERRPHQPDFAAMLREWAEKARRDAVPAQGDLFATPPRVAQALADQWGGHVESAITTQEETAE